MPCKGRERKQRRNAEIRQSLIYGPRAEKINSNYLAHFGLIKVHISTRRYVRCFSSVMTAQPHR